jgi:peptidoglycan/LPS O-acetylase OafA/YrhL
LPPSNAFNYRPDIDGLRALAVTAVLIFHFFPHALPGGFVGVDVFFVISGYLVSGIILKNLSSKKFVFSDFYIRRVRRLFPALALVLSVTAVAGSFTLLSDEFQHLGSHILAGSGFFSNILLYSESGYFDKLSKLKPLLHLWSLSIEEQFYLVWPIFLWMTWKNKYFRILLLLATTFSLLSCFWLTTKDPSMSFFLLPTRLLELSFGAQLAAGFPSISKLKNRRNTKLTTGKNWGHYSRYFAPANFGLLIILSSLFFLSESVSFPTPWAIPIVIATGLIITSPADSLINRILAQRYICYIGLISYPLYLWHWPLLSFAEIITSGNLTTALRFSLLTLSFILASLTFHYVETPFKSWANSRRDILLFCGGPIIATALIGLMIHSNSGFPKRFETIEKIHKTKIAFKSTEETDVGKICRAQHLEIEMCAVSDSKKNPQLL